MVDRAHDGDRAAVLAGVAHEQLAARGRGEASLRCSLGRRVGVRRGLGDRVAVGEAVEADEERLLGLDEDQHGRAVEHAVGRRSGRRSAAS